MEPQLPVALEVALYAASIAIVVAAVVLVAGVIHSRKSFDRLVGAVEELRTEVKPLAQETRIVAKRIGDLSMRAEEQWTAVEGIIGTARRWSERVNRVVDEVGGAVEPFAFAATRGVRVVQRGLAVVGQFLPYFGQQSRPTEKTEDLGRGAGTTAPQSTTSTNTDTESEEQMSDMNQNNGASILVAAVVGAAVGAVVALLMAPASGKETRGWLVDKTREVKDKTTSAIERGKDATLRAAREFKRDTEGATDDSPASADARATTNRG